MNFAVKAQLLLFGTEALPAWAVQGSYEVMSSYQTLVPVLQLGNKEQIRCTPSTGSGFEHIFCVGLAAVTKDKES